MEATCAGAVTAREHSLLSCCCITKLKAALAFETVPRQGAG